MKDALSDSLLSQFSELVAARTALHFPRERWGDLVHKAGSAAKEFGFDNVQAFIRWLTSSPMTQEQIEILSSHLTISETYFWREPQVFEALEEQILPELIRSCEQSDRQLRIWSAGCATGEEPYSIAIALRRVIPALEDWRITILATDINPRILRKASTGLYSEWSFRNAPPWLKERYFRLKKDGKCEILPEIRKMVTFAYLNLSEDIYPSPLNNTNAMDVIFCRNVLMYFTPERARSVGQRLNNSLVQGGWLMVGACELSQLLFPQFAAVHFPGTIVYRKGPPNPQPAVEFHLETNFDQQPFIPQPLKPVAELEWLAPPIEFSMGDMIPPAEGPALQHPVYTRVEKVDEEAPCGITLSVRTLANLGKLTDALALCEKAIAKYKLDPGLYFLRATILQELNREGESVASFKGALYLDPDFVLAHFALGNLAIRQGDVRTGRRCFENVLSLLTARHEEDILPESEGLTAGRFKEIIHATMQMGALA